MDLIDQIRTIAARAENTKHIIQTEEATKNAFIMPFIQALGYNVFDPLEVAPELVADIGTKKGEKVDYAILKDNKPIIIFECKKCGADLNINHASQLFRYFHVSEARFAVLTNGISYQFFTDLENPNKMDEKPFLEINITDLKDTDANELKKFAKSSFDVDTILVTANELKYARHIKNVLNQWMTSPSDEFVKLVCADLMAGKKFIPAIKEKFIPITIRAFQQLISDKINERLKVAMSPESTQITPETYKDADPDTQSASAENTVSTTPEELEGYYTIKAILRDTISTKRIFLRDAQSYCAILLDDNNRKPICRLRFNNRDRLVIGIFNGKEEEKMQIADIDDIYKYSDRIRATILAYTNTKPTETETTTITQ